MKSGATRQRVLLAGLGLALVIAGVARWGGRGQPAAALAAAEPPPPPAADWAEVDRLVATLTRSTYQPLPPELLAEARDLFTPTPLLEAALLTPEPAATGVAPAESQPAAPPPQFSDRHQLLGIVLGAVPLAIVDELLIPLQGELDGHVLVDVQRAAVVFEERGTGVRHRLELQGRPPDQP